MSFLPYDRAPAATWFTAVGGSSLLHAALLASALASSVALLPPVSRNTLRAPDFEVSLEILDMEIVDEAPLVPPDAVPLSPETAPLLEPDAVETATLENETNTATLPDEQALIVPEPETIDAEQSAEETLLSEVITQPTEVIAPEVPDIPEQEFAELFTLLEPKEPQQETSNLAELEPVVLAQPAPVPDLDGVIISDIDPIAEEVINPLAETVAVAPIETLQPETAINTEIAAVALPDPNPLPLEATQDVTLPTPQETEPLPDLQEPVELAALPEETHQDPPVSASEPVTETTPNSTNAIANPTPETQAIATLLQRIRATPNPACTLALPRRAGPDGVALSLISAAPDSAKVEEFRARITDGVAPTPAVSLETIDPRQCATLDTIRRINSYPASRIGISLNDTTLSNGDSLIGRVSGAGGLNLALLLVDDNGVVQDMSRFATTDGSEITIEAPVARAGPSRATRQVLLAIGGTNAAVDFSQLIGQVAQDAFARLPADALAGMVFGLATFDVR